MWTPELPNLATVRSGSCFFVVSWCALFEVWVWVRFSERVQRVRVWNAQPQIGPDRSGTSTAEANLLAACKRWMAASDDSEVTWLASLEGYLLFLGPRPN